jgi:mannose-6-phosphate isomerase-like protein (cupin superfamily)
MTIVRFDGDKIAERWGLSDVAGLRQQLMAVPPPDGEVVYVAPNESHSTTRVLGVLNVCKATIADTNGAFSLFISTVPSGEGVPIHTHHKEDEAYYILEGEFEMYDITHHKTLRVGPGSYIYVPQRTEHGFKCVSPNDGKMVLIITPGGLEGFFEGIGQVITDVSNLPPPPSGSPDFAKAAEVAAKYNITFVVPG